MTALIVQFYPATDTSRVMIVQQTPHSRRHGVIVGLAVYAAALAAVAVWFAFFQFASPSIERPQERAKGPGTSERYTGAIVMRREGGGCRHMKFDNNTGSLQEQAADACADRPIGSNSTEDRMSAIRGAFSRK